jgi:hypothetical protein
MCSVLTALVGIPDGEVKGCGIVSCLCVQIAQSSTGVPSWGVWGVQTPPPPPRNYSEVLTKPS